MSDMIGFIGLGHLGLPMATNLRDAGYSLLVYNRTASKADSLVAQGARLATRPVDAVTTGGIVVTIVWDDAALEHAHTNIISRSDLSELWQDDCRGNRAFQPESDTAEGCWSIQKHSATGRVAHAHVTSFARPLEKR